MMSCAEVRPILSFLLEKETGPLETLEARRHLEGCLACRARADRMSTLMKACSDLPMMAPPADLTRSVMAKLRSLRAVGADRTSAAGKWGGLALVLAAGLALLSRPVAPLFRAFGAPVTLLAGLFAGGDSGGGAQFAERVVGIAVRFVGLAVGPDLAASAGFDTLLVARLVGTALSIGFLLAIPVAVLTACFLHAGASRR